MDSMEPDQTPFAAVSAHTSRLSRVSYSSIYLDLATSWRNESEHRTDMMEIAIPSMAGQIDALCSVQMVRDNGTPHGLLPENIHCAGMVYWYT
jgi:hypothetical protein